MLKLPETSTPYLGVALLIAIGSFSLGGIIGALLSVQPTDSEVNAITGLISFLAGSLVGRSQSVPDERKV